MFGKNYLSHYPSQYIRKGDRLFVRIMQGHTIVTEFMVDSVEDYTSLLGEIRYVGSNLQGLAKVFIRNHSRGWSEERPLMFYQGMPAPRRSMVRRRLQGAASQEPVHSATGMLAPWQTH